MVAFITLFTELPRRKGKGMVTPIACFPHIFATGHHIGPDRLRESCLILRHDNTRMVDNAVYMDKENQITGFTLSHRIMGRQKQESTGVHHQPL